MKSCTKHTKIFKSFKGFFMTKDMNQKKIEETNKIFTDLIFVVSTITRIKMKPFLNKSKS